jgi:hypothetical protein
MSIFVYHYRKPSYSIPKISTWFIYYKKGIKLINNYSGGQYVPIFQKFQSSISVAPFRNVQKFKIEYFCHFLKENGVGAIGLSYIHRPTNNP